MSKDRKDNKNNLILLKNDKKAEIRQLNDNENDLKKKLLDIEKKIDSIDNVIESIKLDHTGTIYESDAFDMLVSSVAITAAVYAIAEYLDIEKDNLDKLF